MSNGNTVASIDVTFENLATLDTEFGSVYRVEDNHVLYATTATWESQTELVTKAGYLYIYSDYRQDEQNNNIASVKVGDGTSLLSALPFADKLLYLHTADTVIHITQAERELWNKSANALHWLGVTTTPLTDGASTNPITIDDESVTAIDGDIVSYNSKEFVFNGSVWQELGDLSDVYTKSQVDTLLADKMNKNNPTGTGSFSLNRDPNGSIGTNSFVEGSNGVASGNASHSEGNNTKALFDYAHAEGNNTIALGRVSHAEGDNTLTSGDCSHAEGYVTNAKGDYSHAEGNNTKAKHRSQHVFGEYNIEDTNSASSSNRGTYIEIVGNGTKNSARSNARTLDWSGNETIAGDLTYNGNTSLTSAISNVNTRIDNLPEPMVFKGSLGTGGTITELPVDGSADRGWTYKVIEAGTYAGQSADIGDTFICDSKTLSANTWTLIPSGDEPSGTVTSIQIQASSPINIDNSTAITTSGTRTISHANSGATAGDYGDSSAQTPAVGGTFKVPYISVNATGHITNINAHNVTMPVPTATDVTYDNTVSGLSATNAQSAIDEIKSSLGVWLTGTLTAVQTTLVLSDTSITTDSIVDNVYVPDTFFGVNPTNITVATGSVTLTFPVQSSDLPVKVRVF